MPRFDSLRAFAVNSGGLVEISTIGLMDWPEQVPVEGEHHGERSTKNCGD